MERLTRQDISDLIYNRISEERSEIKAAYEASRGAIGYFFIDDLLPDDLACKCFEVFPDPKDMRLLNSIREYKYISAQMDQHNALVEDVIYAFQDPKIVNLIADICSNILSNRFELVNAIGLS